MAPLDGRRRQGGATWRTAALRPMAAVAAIVVGLTVAVGDVLAALGGSTEPEPAPAAEGLLLSDDDSASSLFAMSNVGPGHRRARCIAISYRGVRAPRVVKLHGSGTATELDQALEMTVEVGSGGGFEDCTGFSGTVLYQGSLADFLAAHGDFESGLAALSPSEPNGSATFRFAMTVGDRPTAQGRAARATFTWEARDTAVEPTPTPAAPRDPDAPKTRPAQGKGTAAAPAHTDANEPVDPETADVQLRSGAPSQSGAEVRPSSRRRDEAPPSALERLGRLAVEASKKAAFPLVLLLVVGLFLVLQDRIDRKDPKLALAPVYPDPDLPFSSARRDVR